MFWLTLCGLVVLLLIVLLSRESLPESRSALIKVTICFLLFVSNSVFAFCLVAEKMHEMEICMYPSFESIGYGLSLDDRNVEREWKCGSELSDSCLWNDLE